MDWQILLVWVFVGGLLLYAAGAFCIGVWSLTWPSVDGTVEVSLLETEMQGEQARESHHLAYVYEIHGIRYLRTRVRPWGDYDWSIGTPGDTDGFWRGHTLWSRARDLAKWYRPGATVKVYYCPLHPGWSCLEPGGLLAPLVFGGVAFVFYIALLRSSAGSI